MRPAGKKCPRPRGGHFGKLIKEVEIYLFSILSHLAGVLPWILAPQKFHFMRFKVSTYGGQVSIYAVTHSSVAKRSTAD